MIEVAPTSAERQRPWDFLLCSNLYQAWKLTLLSNGPTAPKSHNLLPNAINCTEVIGHFTGPLKISTGPT